MDEAYVNRAFPSDTAPPLPSIEGSVGSAGSRRKKSLKTRAKSHAAAEHAEGFHQGSAGFQVGEKVHASWLAKGFRLRGDGSIMHEVEPDQWEWLCSPLVVEAATRNAEGEAWGRLIRIRDRDGVWHEWSMPMAELAGAGDGYRARLLGMGLELAPGTKARNALHRLLTAADPKGRARCVSTLGWHGDAYMLPDQVIGQADGESFEVTLVPQVILSEQERDAVRQASFDNSAR